MNKLAVMIILQLIFFTGELIACSCMGSESVKEAFKRSQVVFYGTVVSCEPFELKRQPLGEGFIEIYNHYEVAFEVTEWFKGTPTEIQLIYTGTGGGDCGFNFQTGQQYIVYASQEGVYMELGQSKMETNICDRTNHLKESQEDLALLRKIRK